MPEPLRCYWDANVFLSYVDGHPDRLPHIDALLAQAGREEVEIITSTVSIMEVAFGSAEQDQGALLPEIQEKISGLWRPASPIRLAEVSVLVVEEAREMMRNAIQRARKFQSRWTPYI